ncbi:MAG: hypothetical protein IPJ27_05460 [Candidatus Accumulibacter sp.]|uniref:Uncharacterized protein n=1 Tax=Candidatus Accumulibacter proximus TaxID=2954385 RepID=A0A935UG19_9PROT|nr:hypothetical protein [Candidatus Accumulibacter proximus]
MAGDFPLRLEFAGGVSLPLSEISLSRALGESVRWRFTVAIHPESWDDGRSIILEQLRRQLIASPCQVAVSWQGESRTMLSPRATVVGASRIREGQARIGGIPTGFHYVEIEADATAPEPQPDAFQPRRRTHRVRNLKQLIERLEHVAIPLGALVSEFAEIEFADGEHASIIQDEISDWRFLLHVLEQCGWLAGPHRAWLPLTLVGGVNEKGRTHGRWLIVPGAKRAYEDWGTVRQRTISVDPSFGEGETEFAGLATGKRVPAFPAGHFPSVVDRRPQRSFSEESWNKWRTMDLPRFTEDGAMIWRINDRLYFGGQGLGWESETHAVPPEMRIGAPDTSEGLRPWVGLGRVEETSRTGPWLKVRLPGFESGDDLVNVRIATPYAGTNGRRGLHMVPENGTEVLLAWSGLFGQSIVLVGNARSETAEHPSPSLYIEAEHTAQYADIHVVKIGETTIDSAFKIRVQQRTDIASSQRFQLKADGAELKLAQGVVHTGRGI